MNYLAHIYLSGKDDAILAGNFAGDFVKGRAWTRLPERMGQGVLLHRFIDSFADDHVQSANLRVLLHPAVGKFAGVALDVIYDHLLASQWGKYGEGELNSYTNTAYARIAGIEDELPEAARALFHAMRSGNWLYNYRKEEQLERVFLGMQRRFGPHITLAGAEIVFKEHREEFMNAFELFFTDMQSACFEKISSFGRINKAN